MQIYVHYYCSNPNQRKILWYIFDWALCAQKPLVASMHISHVLFMQISYALHDDCGQKHWNAGQSSSLLDGNISDVGEQTNY